MSILIVVVHIVVCIALIMIVLLQTGKGADMGAAFGGGGSQTLFGATGASTFLSKATTIAAVVFMLTSLFLAYSAGKRSNDSMLSDLPGASETTTVPASTTSPVSVTPSGSEPEKQQPAAQQAASPSETKTAEPTAGESVPKK